MLLDNLGIRVTQRQVETAGGAAKRIKKYGMRVDQLGKAVKKLTPQTEFWFKDHGTINQLRMILNRYDSPVGIEWQGLFETKGEHVNDGHYSIVANIDDKKKELIIVDPYKDFVYQDRIFSIGKFIRRWWDTNDIVDPKTKKKKTVKDIKMFFVIVPKNTPFPKLLKMKKYV